VLRTFAVKSRLVFDSAGGFGRPPRKSTTAESWFSIVFVLKPTFQIAGNIQSGKSILLCLLLFGLVFWTFLPSLTGDFIEYDDFAYVTGNSHLDLTPGNLARPLIHWEAAYWHPLTMWSLMLDHRLYGLNPWGYHLTNVLLHAVNTVLAFLVLYRMTGALWRSLLVAGLFGLHPQRVESVAWISERKDVLSVLFWMLALGAYTRYAQCAASDRWPATRTAAAGAPASFLSRVTCPPPRFYSLALLFFALGLMSKPMVVTLPFVLLLLDYWPLARWSRQNLRGLVEEKIPFFLLSAVFCVVTYFAQKYGGMLKELASVSAPLPFVARLDNALVAYGRYLGNLFWPVNLCAFYPHPGHWPAKPVVLAGLLILGLSGFAWVVRRRWPHCLVGWLWYLGALVPVIGLVQVGSQSMADRFSYIPSIGILIVLVWSVHHLTKRWPHQGILLGVAGGLTVLAGSALTRHEMVYWQDGVSLWRRAAAVTENNYDAYNRLGRALYSQKHYAEAARALQEAVRLNPGLAEAYCSLGQAFAAEGRMDEAIAACQKALEVRPGYVTAHNNLADFLIRAGRLDEAMVHCRRAVEIEPDGVTSLNNLGNALSLEGHFAEALVPLQRAQSLQPDNHLIQVNLGSVLFRMGRLDEAIQDFRLALKSEPDNAQAHNNLGGALLSKGQAAEAVDEFQQAVRLQPGRFEAHRNLGHALLKQGHLDEAIREFQAALNLNPDSAAASNDLITALGLKQKTAAPPPPAGH